MMFLLVTSRTRLITGCHPEHWQPALTGTRLDSRTKGAAIMNDPSAAYCNAYATWRTAVETLDDIAKRDPVMHGLIVRTRAGGAMQNPLVLTARQAANDFVRYAGEFGMAPAARA